MNSKYTQREVILYCLKFVRVADTPNKDFTKFLDLLIKKYEKQKNQDRITS